MKTVDLKKIISNLTVYGLAHAAVDATCAAIIFFMLFKGIDYTEFFYLVVIYNVLAFGLQSIFGLLVDKFDIPKFSAVSGSIITALATIFPSFSPITAVTLAGIGNALFHVGAGSISLNLTPRKATAPGIYVAPGALGLLIGTLVGKFGYFSSWYFILTLALLCVFIIFIKTPIINYKRENKRFSYFELILFLILLAIVIRSLVGLAIIFPWKSNLNLLIILTAAVVLGKGLGGIFADKFGWIRLGIVSLFISAFLLIFGASSPAIGIAGMFLFNITMPITLVAISNSLPGRPAFSFGLTCLALLIGALPVLFGLKTPFNNIPGILITIIISALALYFGLRLYNKYIERNKFINMENHSKA